MLGEPETSHLRGERLSLTCFESLLPFTPQKESCWCEAHMSALGLGLITAVSSRLQNMMM